MSDHATKLREIASIKTSVLYSKRVVLNGAADEIDRLTRELAEAREALANDYVLKSEAWDGCQKSARKARDKALEAAAKVADEEADQSRALMFDLRTIKDYRSAKQLEREAETLLRVAAGLRALKEKP